MFHYPRYLDGKDGSPKKSNFTLERLHKMAEERSLERRKRKDKEPAESIEEELDGSIEMSRLTINRESVMSDEEVQPKKKRRKKDSSKGKERLCGNKEDAVALDNHEESSLKKKMKECRLQPLLEKKSADEVCEEEEHEIEVGSECEGQEEVDKDGGAVEEDLPSLRPLGHAQSASNSKLSKVHRELPTWVASPHLVEDDITNCSRLVGEFPLPQVLIRNLDNIGVKKFFPVQVHVIPYVLSYTHGPLRTGLGGATPPDVFVCAPTGCGKTLCYALPIVKSLMHRVVTQVRALVVVPSQELASQVVSVFDQMTRGTGLSVARISGQLPLESECAMLHETGSYPTGSKVDILVATPGRLVDHLDRGSFASLAYLRFLVIDEADKILDYHFNHWLPKLLEAVASDKATPPGRGTSGALLSSSLQSLCGRRDYYKLQKSIFQSQSKAVPAQLRGSMETRPHTSTLQKLLFSASMTLSPEQLSKLHLHYPTLFTTQPIVQTSGGSDGGRDLMFTLPSQLVEKLVRCDLEHKPLALLHLVDGRVSGCGQEQEMNRVLVFTNSRDSTHRLCVLLKNLAQFSVSEISGSVGVAQRQVVLNDFRSGRVRVLVCSDQMARGIDIEGVTCIVNYEPPRQYRVYLHRAGRTARAGQGGVVYTLLAKDEVHPFKVMLRKSLGHKKSMEEVKISTSDLQDYLPQYDAALDKLRQIMK